MGMEVSLIKEKRIQWIDVCKGILIITIVLFHIDYTFWLNNAIGKYVNGFTSLYKVSVFFCVAGLTLQNERLDNTWEFVCGKIKKIYLKIIIVGLGAVFFHNIFISIGFYDIGVNYSGKIMKVYGWRDILKQTILTIFMANREVIIGPMWYANVLFMGLILLAFLDRVIRLCINGDSVRKWRFVVTVCLMLISSVLTNVFAFTVPRFNNTLVVIFLIDLCQLLYMELEWKFDNSLIFVLAFLILVNLPLYGSISMVNNYFVNPAYLIVAVICGMYVLYFISQKVNGYLQKILSFIGRYSFWIMAFHFIAFKIGSVFLNFFIKVNIGSLVPATENIFGLGYYLIIGIFLPCVFGMLLEKLVN